MPNARPVVPLTELQREKVAANINLAYAYAWFRKKHIKCMNDDDVIELAFIGLCRAAQIHDPDRGKLSTIASLCMRNSINSGLVASHQKRRMPTGVMFGLHAVRGLGKDDPSINDVDIADWLECFQG